MHRNIYCDAQRSVAVIKFLERLFARLAAPYGYELARLPDEAFRSLLARI